MIVSAQAEIYRSFVLEDRRWPQYFNSRDSNGLRRLPLVPLSSHPHTSTAQKRVSMLDIFPIELLFFIKDHIPEVELCTHVSYSQVLGLASKTIYTEGYWERACVRFGLGLTIGEDPADICWREFVYDIIRQDGFCNHPHCGVRRLEQNCKYGTVDRMHQWQRVFTTVSCRPRDEQGKHEGFLPEGSHASSRIKNAGRH